MIPVLLKPKVYTWKNKWLRNNRDSSSFSREIFLLIASFLIMYGMYGGAWSVLHGAKISSSAIDIPAHELLSIFLVPLFFLLIFSSLVTTLGSLFFSKDLDLILSSPLSIPSFFFGKLVRILMSSSWMTIVFCLPVLYAFGQSFSAGWTYPFFGSIILFSYLTIPTAISIALIILLGNLVPITRTKELFMIGAIIVFSLLLYFTQFMTTSSGAAVTITQLSSVLSSPYRILLPPYWTAVCLGELLSPTYPSKIPFLILLLSLTTGILAGSYLIIRKLYARALGKAQNNPTKTNISSSKAQSRLIKATPFLNSIYRSLLGKEFKTFSRDMVQCVQMILLLGMCLVYIYNFQVMIPSDSVPSELAVWWKAVLIIFNIGMGAFVTTAVSTRFVFPSISLEGKSLWLIRTAPITPRQILRAKFWSWLVPIGTVSAFIFTAGCLAIDATLEILLITIIASVVTSYGVVGLAIGLGAAWANFDWEEPAELSSSLEALMFMGIAMIFVVANIVPIGSLVFLYTLKELGIVITAPIWIIAVGLVIFFFALLNHMISNEAIRYGVRSLEARQDK